MAMPAIRAIRAELLFTRDGSHPGSDRFEGCVWRSRIRRSVMYPLEHQGVMQIVLREAW